MLDYRVQTLCGGHLQLILLLGDVYVGLYIPVSLCWPPSVMLSGTREYCPTDPCALVAPSS